ncbi:MAG: myo-inosose-2 dehydratase [Dehalococcoidia bacterium]|nr:myo-inosose-2 dehydratase [Dehalococcoidia bacterium]
MFDKSRVRLAAVPNAWCNDDLPELGKDITFEQTIDEMALAGYQGTELGSKYPTDAGVLKAALDLRGMQASGAWVSLFFAARGGAYEQTLDGFRRQIPFFQAVGIRDVYVAEVTHAVHQLPIPALANKPEFNSEQWGALVQGLNEMGKIARDNGLRINYHHHTGTAVQTNEDVDRLMADTDPENVYLLLDTAHITVGGGDALKLTKDHASRIGHVHLKQVRAEVLARMKSEGLSFWDGLREGIFTVPGDPEGMIDMDPILALLAESGYEGWLVVEAEQDPATANPLTYFRMARSYIAEKTGL